MTQDALIISLVSVIFGTTLTIVSVLFFWSKFQRDIKERELQIREEARREALLGVKEESLQFRETAEEEIREQRRELQRLSEKLEAKERNLDEARVILHEREVALAQKEKELTSGHEELLQLKEEVRRELARISLLSEEAAKELYLERVAAECSEASERLVKQIERDSIENAQLHAKRVALEAMQRSMAEYVTEATVSVVMLPSEDFKGRLIGREGRNIRSFEQVTGVDLIIDETPEVVTLSCFDPVRREIARIALESLIEDGRIHPVRIEELYAKAKEEVDRLIRESGEQAASNAGVKGLTSGTLEVLGTLRYRASFGQNVLDHSVEVAKMCHVMAAELGLDGEVAARAGLLHDIGKALGTEWEGPHAISGMNFLKTQGESGAVLNAIGAHHYDIHPETPEAHLVIAADTLSAARPGARRDTLENHTKRLAKLEEIALSFPGVERSFAVQSGREVRLLVKPEVMDDLAAGKLANAMARRVEKEMTYPGQIKITVIRESRFTDVAR